MIPAFAFPQSAEEKCITKYRICAIAMYKFINIEWTMLLLENLRIYLLVQPELCAKYKHHFEIVVIVSCKNIPSDGHC